MAINYENPAVSGSQCRLCGNLSKPGPGCLAARAHRFECRRCGTYEITWEADSDLPDFASVPWGLRCATRQASDAGTALLVKTDNWGGLAERHQATTVAENAERLLDYVARCCPRPGQTAEFDPDLDHPVIDAGGPGELVFFVDYLDRDGLILRPNNRTWGVTVKGWERIVGPASSGYTPGRCFVAMSFALACDPIYAEGIRPAVTDAGYHPVCMKHVLTNEDINFRILSELRKAEFLVADFTGHRGGVYFEAGFALALRREVFWTCSEADRLEVHFDTNHFQYIFWKDYADLRARLTEKIIALRGRSPIPQAAP